MTHVNEEKNEINRERDDEMRRLEQRELMKTEKEKGRKLVRLVITKEGEEAEEERGWLTKLKKRKKEKLRERIRLGICSKKVD